MANSKQFAWKLTQTNTIAFQFSSNYIGAGHFVTV